MCLIFSQALTFVLPALVLGLLLSFPALNVISKVLYNEVQVNLDPKPVPVSVVYALGIGLSIPLLSAIKPI